MTRLKAWAAVVAAVGIAAFAAGLCRAGDPPGSGSTGTKGEAAPAGVDPAIPAYQVVQGVGGPLSSIGSDTLNDLMTLWSEGFNGLYPSTNLQIEGKGSGTAPKGLIDGASNFGPMSREMKPEESAGFEKKFGYKPTNVAVSLDALAVYVNKDNPIEKLTLQQVDSIFSSTRKRSGSDITTWGQLGLTGEWASLPISLYGRNSASGTYGYFKEHVLSKGDYKPTVKEAPGSAAVVQGVTADRGGVGYSGIGYRTSGVRPVPIVDDKEGKAYEAVAANVYSGKYGISRSLYIYVNKPPGQGLPPAVREFLMFVLSKEGQEIVLKGGFVPLTAQMVAESRARLN